MRNREQISELIIEGLATTFRLDRERIVPSARLYEDLDVDSIDAVDLAARLQRETGARLSSEVFKSVRTVSDLVSAVDRLLNGDTALAEGAAGVHASRVQDQSRS
ncbi:MAG: acyl carrier protein [Phycisphaerae bacterium]|nr:acyl carrier protein [Gemmatimonadaceae bacterium]